MKKVILVSSQEGVIMSIDSKFFEVEQKENYIQIIFKSKSDLNSLSIKRINDIKDVLENYKYNPTILSVVFRSDFEKAFIAGADLEELQNMNQFQIYNAEFQKFISYLREYPKITLSMLTGFVYGGGFEFSLACDFRICSETVDAKLPETTLGIIPGGMGTQLLPLLVGESKAKQLIILNESMNSQQLYDYGLAYQISEFQNFDQEISSFVCTLSKGAPRAQEIAKTSINSANEMKNGTVIERISQSLLFSSEDKNIGISSFLKKEKPTYKGK